MGKRRHGWAFVCDEFTERRNLRGGGTKFVHVDRRRPSRRAGHIDEKIPDMRAPGVNHNLFDLAFLGLSTTLHVDAFNVWGMGTR